MAFRGLPIETKDESFFSSKIRIWLSGLTHVWSHATPVSFMAGAQIWSQGNRIDPDFLIVQGKICSSTSSHPALVVIRSDEADVFLCQIPEDDVPCPSELGWSRSEYPRISQ